MQKFMEWKIKDLIHNDSEIYFNENFIGIRTENEPVKLPGQKTYTVIDNDEDTNIVTLLDEDGNRYKFDQDELAKALAEDSQSGFRALQYPVSYLLTTSGTDLSKLSIYDGRLKKFITGKGEKPKMAPPINNF